MACVTSLSYNLVINGKMVSHITLSRGLHQGDPFSPYLFIMIVDVLSRGINKLVSDETSKV